jgi:hypothetical protein
MKTAWYIQAFCHKHLAKNQLPIKRLRNDYKPLHVILYTGFCNRSCDIVDLQLHRATNSLLVDHDRHIFLLVKISYFNNIYYTNM